MEYGVLKRSILSPLLFLAYINDLPSNIEDSKVILYVDDTTILNSSSSQNECIDNNLEAQSKAKLRFDSNSLDMNIDKSVYMFLIFKTSVTLNLGQANKTLFPGITIDDQILWNAQGDNLAKKLNKNTYLLRRLSNNVSQENIISCLFCISSLCNWVR